MGEFEDRLSEGYAKMDNAKDANDLYHSGTADPDGQAFRLDIDSTLSLALYRTRNGWLVWDGEAWGVIEDPEPWDLMSELADILGVIGTKYDARRLTIGYAPGYCHHDYHPQLCRDCACRCDPDRSDASVAENRTDVYGSEERTTPEEER